MAIADDDKDPKKGTTGREHDKDNDEDQPVGSESPAIHETRPDAQTTTNTASQVTLPTTDTSAVPSSYPFTVGGRVHFRRVMSPNTQTGVEHGTCHETDDVEG